MVVYEGYKRSEPCDNCPIKSEEFLNKLAERAAEKAFERVYSEVGKSVFKRLAWIVGIAVVSLIYWLGKEHIGLIK